MNMKFNALCLATLGGLASLVTPQTASAAVVGEYNVCNSENLSVPITATGNTWVQVTTVDAASLQNLDALVYRTCNTSYAGNAAVDSAVAGGMALVLDFNNSASLPGAPAFTFNGVGQCEVNYSIAPFAPVATGPGGNLTDDSLDVGSPGGGSGFCSIMGTTPIATLPAGVIPFVTTSDGNNAGALGYSYSAGRVAVSMSQWSNYDVYTPSEYLYSGIKTYFLNALDWALNGSEPTTTCASEGYKGAQLTWCKNICENGLSGQVLDTWIHRWIGRYRQLPYCAVGK